MADRINLIDRKGVNAFERAMLNDFKWIFREQPIVDVGIDATIERSVDNNPTGEQIAVQIKTGLGNVKVNKDGNFDYYLSLVHYQYWTLYPIPVIFVLYDDVSDILYWSAVYKRNMPKTKGYKRKITLNKESIISIDTINDFENLIRIYQTKVIVDDYDFSTDYDELVDYSCELLAYCSDSISKVRQYLEDFDKAFKSQFSRLEKFVDEHPKNTVQQQIVDKEIRKTAAQFTLATNIFRTRLSNEMPIMVETHVKSLQFMNQHIFPQLKQPEFYTITRDLINELFNEITSISLLIDTVNELSESFKNKKHQWSVENARAEQNCSLILDDYKCELSDLVDMMKGCIKTMEDAIKN